MAVFLAAGDESDHPTQGGAFLYGGYVAPVTDWWNWFAPAWEERVLNRDPPIPYLHMAEIRTSSWRKKYGLTEAQAEHRIDEAVRVIRSSGGLHPLTTSFDGGHFRRALGGIKVARDEPQWGTYRVEPDFVGFQGFAINALYWVHHEYPDAEYVDFMVERKQRVTHYLPVFKDALVEGLERDGRGELVRLIGDLLPVDKKRVPVQASDVLLWHFRRREEGCSELVDDRRLAGLLDGRLRTHSSVTTDQIDQATRRLMARATPMQSGRKSKG